jgi:hypothetical protein
MSRGDPLRQEIIKQTFVLKDLPVTVDGATGVGFGSAVLGDFPEGNILMLGAVSYVQIGTLAAQAGLVDTWSGDYGIGTTPAGDATITAGDVDLIQSTAVGPAVAELSPLTRGTHLPADTGEIHDNTDGSLELNLNVLVDDVDISADGVAVVANGTVVIAYIMLGDD